MDQPLPRLLTANRRSVPAAHEARPARGCGDSNGATDENVVQRPGDGVIEAADPPVLIVHRRPPRLLIIVGHGPEIYQRQALLARCGRS
jgi:hypothetical protein